MNESAAVRRQRHLAAKRGTEEECNRLAEESQHRIQADDERLQIKLAAASSTKVPHTLHGQVEEIKGITTVAEMASETTRLIESKLGRNERGHTESSGGADRPIAPGSGPGREGRPTGNRTADGRYWRDEEAHERPPQRHQTHSPTPASNHRRNYPLRKQRNRLNK